MHIDLARGKLLLTVQTSCATVGWSVRLLADTKSEYIPENKHIAVGGATSNNTGET